MRISKHRAVKTRVGFHAKIPIFWMRESKTQVVYAAAVPSDIVIIAHRPSHAIPGTNISTKQPATCRRLGTEKP